MNHRWEKEAKTPKPRSNKIWYRPEEVSSEVCVVCGLRRIGLTTVFGMEPTWIFWELGGSLARDWPCEECQMRKALK